MSSQKKQVPVVGVWPVFRLDVLRLAKKMKCVDLLATESLPVLCEVAIRPRWLTERPTVCTPQMFAKVFDARPDFVIEMMRVVRRKFRKLNHSKSGRVQWFLATNVTLIPGDTHGREIAQWSASDGQIAQALSLKPDTGGIQSPFITGKLPLSNPKQDKAIQTDDVVKARKELVGLILAGRKLEKSLRPKGWKLL